MSERIARIDTKSWFMNAWKFGEDVSATNLTTASWRLAGRALAGLVMASLAYSGGAAASTTPAYPKLFGTVEKR